MSSELVVPGVSRKGDVSIAVESVNEIPQSAASAAEQTSPATGHLASMAQGLQTMAAQFTITEDVSGNAAMHCSWRPRAKDTWTCCSRIS